MPIRDIAERHAYQLRWIANRRKKYFLTNGPCVKCGSWDNLELDHINPDLKIDHRIWNWSEERRSAELAKCQILCHDCHLSKTHDDRRRNIPHGTDSTYTAHACRCDLCREAHRLKRRQDRLNGYG